MFVPDRLGHRLLGAARRPKRCAARAKLAQITSRTCSAPKDRKGGTVGFLVVCVLLRVRVRGCLHGSSGRLAACWPLLAPLLTTPYVALLSPIYGSDPQTPERLRHVAPLSAPPHAVLLRWY